MRKTKTVFVILISSLLLILSACGNSVDQSDASSSKSSNELQSEQTSEDSTVNDSTNSGSNSSSAASSNSSETVDSGSSHDLSSENESVSHSSDTDHANQESSASSNGPDAVTDAVIHAALHIKSQEAGTTVDYGAKTMTQGAQKVTFSLEPAAGHEEDFKVGLIKENIDNDDEQHAVTLYSYQLDRKGQLILADPAYDQPVYGTYPDLGSGANSVTISSGEAAADYLKQQLNMENNDDLIFEDTDGSVENDEIGPYYMIILISKSMREQGGSGTAGLYKVYQDGTFLLK